MSPDETPLASIDHVNIVVEDLEGMLAFYRDVLGLEVTKEATISGDWIESVVGLAGVVGDVVYLGFPAGPRLELIRYRSPEGERPVGLERANTPGLRHLAFTVDDIDAVADGLRERGVDLLGDVQTMSDSQVTYAGGRRKRLVYFRDPEGNLLELCSYR